MKFKEDVRFLSVTYKNEGTWNKPKIVIHLYGITRSNKRVLIKVPGFLPYFDLIEPPASTIQLLMDDPEVLKIEPVELYAHGYVRCCYRVTVKTPFSVPRYRRELSHRCEVFAADIPFGMRFFYDYDLDACMRVLGIVTKKGDYNVDTVVRAKKFKKCKTFVPNLRILSFDIENSVKTGEIYCICTALQELGDPAVTNARFINTGSEETVITEFLAYYYEANPDVLTGYNIDGYDIQHLLKRMKELFGKDSKLHIGRDERALDSRGKNEWKCNGVIIADAWRAIKSLPPEKLPKKESLNAVCKHFLGKEKDDVDPSRMDFEWRENRDKVVEYCVKDAELALEILLFTKAIEKAMDIAVVAKCAFEVTYSGTTSNWTDSMLVREFDAAGVAVPCTKNIYKGDRDDKIEGGYVHEVKPDLYHMILVLDFQSMYPSVIMENNLCFTTIHPDGDIVDPLGTHFYSEEQKPGILPRILRKMMGDRKEAKKKMREGKNEGDQIKESYYDGMQYAIKIFMNSFYGVFASSFYRFTDPRIGAAITAFSRENIKRIIKLLDEEGLEIIYSDTDSIFFKSPVEGLEASIEFGKAIAERFSVQGSILEFEKIVDPFFSHGKKKRYFGKVVWPTEEILIRGYETRRTDSFDFLAESLHTLFSIILEGRKADIVPTAKKMIQDLSSGKVDKAKLVISKRTNDPGSYKHPERMANVQAMKKLIAYGYDFIYGMKVGYIVTDSGKGKKRRKGGKVGRKKRKKKLQQVEPWLDGREFTAVPDYDYYVRAVAGSLSKITEVFGFDEKALISGRVQKGLMEGEFIGDGEMEKWKPKKRAKKKVAKVYGRKVKLDNWL